MSNHQLANARPFVARTIHRLAIPIILAWLAITVLVTVGVPALEQVEKEHSVSETPKDAPSFKAMDRIVADFKQANSGSGSGSGSTAMVVLEGQQHLGDDAHRYYEQLVRRLKDDPKHVQHIQDFWGDPLTAGAAQSADGKAVYVQLDLAGPTGTSLAHDSMQAVRNIVGGMPPPPGIKAYVTGPAAISSDMHSSGDRTVLTVTAVSLCSDLRDAAPRLPLGFHRNSFIADGRDRIAGRQGIRRIARPSRAYWPNYLHRKYAGVYRDRCWNGLRHIFYRPLSRGTSGR